MQKLSFALVLAWAAPAAAEQVEPPPPDDNADASAPDPGAPPPPPQGVDPLALWPQRLIDRPLTLPRGLLRAQADAPITRLNGDAGGATNIGLVATASYGASDVFEIGASYALALQEFNAEGPLRVFAQYKLADGPFKAAITGSFTYDVATEVGVAGVGVGAQWNLGPNVALLFGGDQLRSTVVVPQGLDARPSTLSLPVGIGFQANPALFLYAQTSIGAINLQDSNTVLFGRDGEPLQLGLFYSPSNEIDLGLAVVYPNLETAADVFTVLVTGRLFIAN
ncbi:MAG: hypothetical protein KF773_16805 [Deltaproteobacteria bacterium]|nr:hypothetical protein [Deltaproteobacteria bacterium]